MRIVVGSAWMLAALVLADPARGAEDGGAAARSCHAETDDTRRLACYDRVTDRTTTAIAAAPPAALSEDDFGRQRQLAHEEDRKRAEATRAIGELRASITGIATRRDGLMTFTLDNGQVWRQNRPDSRFSIKPGDEILIQPGALGSFILSGPNKKSTRVTRVQ